jgi:hypothetical protein
MLGEFRAFSAFSASTDEAKYFELQNTKDIRI